MTKKTFVMKVLGAVLWSLLVLGLIGPVAQGQPAKTSPPAKTPPPAGTKTPAPPAPSKPAPPPAAAKPGQPPTGDEIMKRVRDHEYSESMDAVISMSLVDKNNKVEVRKFRIQRFKDSVLIRFIEPADIRGTGYLIMKDKDGKSLVYVYFPPPTDDYRQINVEGNDSNQAFLGSDFDITDFQIRNPSETTNTYVRTEKLAGIDCYVVESTFKDPGYKYSKVTSWVRSDYFLPLKAEFYDRSNPPKKVKEMKVYKYKEVGDKRVVSKSEMANNTNGHRTMLELQDIQFDVKFPDDNFTIRRLTKP